MCSFSLTPVPFSDPLSQVKSVRTLILIKNLAVKFVTEYRPSVPNLKNILMSKWHLIENQPLLREIYKDPPLLSYRKERSLGDVLVRAKLCRSKFSYLDQ